MKLAHQRVLALIEPRTEAVPLPLAVISSLVGMNERSVKKLIQELRREYHQPIGHSRKKLNGYYMIRCPEKLRAMVAKLRYEANSRHVTANEMEKALSMQAELF